MAIKALRLAEYYEFARFVATPTFGRFNEWGYDTQLAFCQAHNLTEDTIYRWKRDPDFMAEVKRFIGLWTKDRTPDVIDSLYESAVIHRNLATGEVRFPNPKSQELWLKYVEKWRGTIGDGENPETAAIAAANPYGEVLTDFMLRQYETRQKSNNGNSIGSGA